MTIYELICKLDHAANEAMLHGDHERCVQLENDRDELRIAAIRRDSEKVNEIFDRYGKEVQAMKLKDDKDWKGVFFEDRTILKKDTKIMSKEQVAQLGELEVIPAKRKGFYTVCK